MRLGESPQLAAETGGTRVRYAPPRAWLRAASSACGRQLHATAALGIWTDEAFGTEASGWSFPGNPESVMPPAPAQRPAPHSGPRGTVGDEPRQSRTPMPRPRDRGAPASSRGDHRAGPVSAS